jgi:hypothetical protein
VCAAQTGSRRRVWAIVPDLASKESLPGKVLGSVWNGVRHAVLRLPSSTPWSLASPGIVNHLMVVLDRVGVLRLMAELCRLTVPDVDLPRQQRRASDEDCGADYRSLSEDRTNRRKTTVTAPAGIPICVICPPARLQSAFQHGTGQHASELLSAPRNLPRRSLQ